jgi:MFS family permease
LLAAELTSSPVLVSAVTAAQYLPWLTVAPVGGVMVDRHDRRSVVLTTQAWRGAVMLALAVLVATDLVTMWQLCIVAFVITAGEILVDPSLVAYVPRLVDDDQLDTASGRIASVEIVTNDFAGGPVGAVAFAAATWLPFVLDGCSYLGSLVLFRRLPSTRARVDTADGSIARPSVRADAAEGFRFLRRHAVLWPVTVATMVYFAGAATGMSLLVLLVRSAAGERPWAFGLVLACGAVGALLGTLVGAAVAARVGVRATLSVATLLEGAALASMAATSSVVVLSAVWFLGGVPAGARVPVARSLQQRLAPGHLLGRVNVTARMFTRGVIVTGALAAGSVAAWLGLRTTFVLAGLVEAVAAALMFRSLRGRTVAPANG